MSARLSELNGMERQEVTRLLGNVFERSSWVADRAWDSRPFATTKELHDAMMAVVAAASDQEQLDLIRAHPDLGTRLGSASLTAISAKEQKDAGLSSLTPEDYETFAAWNRAYTDKFGFPFILAVRGRSKEEVLAAMRLRMGNAEAEEREEALRQIGRIAEFRLRDLLETEE